MFIAAIAFLAVLLALTVLIAYVFIKLAKICEAPMNKQDEEGIKGKC